MALAFNPPAEVADIGLPMASIERLVFRYVRARQGAGEMSLGTACGTFSTLMGLADTAGRDRPPSAITRDVVEEWLRTRRVRPSTKRKQLSQVRCFCRWLIIHRQLRADPTLGIRGPAQPRLADRRLHTEWLLAIYAACVDSRDVCVVTLMLQLGLRCVEVHNLQVGDLDFMAMTVDVLGKSGHARTLPLTVEARQAIEAYLADVPAAAGPLVRSYREPTAALLAKSISVRVARLTRDAGIRSGPHDGRTAHGLRRTMASDLVDRGANLRDVQTALGHASLEATTRYVGRSGLNQLREVMEGRGYRP